MKSVIKTLLSMSVLFSCGLGYAQEEQSSPVENEITLQADLDENGSVVDEVNEEEDWDDEDDDWDDEDDYEYPDMPVVAQIALEGSVNCQVLKDGGDCEQAVHSRSSDSDAWAIVEPESGTYQVILEAEENQPFSMELMYFDYKKQSSMVWEADVFYDDKCNAFSFKIDNERDYSFICSRAMFHPEDLTTKDVEGKIYLSWKDPIGDRLGDVDYYEVFSYGDYETLRAAKFYKKTKEKELLTDHEWINDDENTAYCVRAVLQDGRATFLSQYAFNSGDDDDDDDWDENEQIQAIVDLHEEGLLEY